MKRILLIGLLAFILAGCGQSKKEDPVNTATPIENPLLSEFNTPFGVPAFDQIKSEHYMPAFEKAMADHKAEIEVIVKNGDPASFKNTMEPLFNSGALLGRVSAVFYSQLSVNGTDAMLKIQGELDPKLAAHADSIRLDERVFARVKAVYEKRLDEGLNAEQTYLLENQYKGFVRNGANLDAEQKKLLSVINQELAVAEAKFSENLLNENRSFQLVIDKPEDLEGLPTGVITAAADEAKAMGKEGMWAFTTDKPSMLPFLTYSLKRDLRAKLYDAYTHRGDKGNASDNKEILAKIFNLRTRKARMLGYDHFANYILESKMAKNLDGAMGLLNQLWPPALNLAKKEAADLQSLIDREKGNFKLAASDWWYYTEKLRKEKYDLDDNELRPYFKLQNVIDGALLVANRLYGLSFHPISAIPLPHPEALAYEVKEADGTHVGVLYMDYHPRKEKQVGAWCGAYREARYQDDKRIPPVVTMVGNFTRASGDTPSLLSLDEVATLFHEFGHALDGLLAENAYATTYVATDFVELPSQIMEHWAVEPEVLNLYARHYQTGEVIPAALVEKITKSSLFNQGFTNTEFLAACLLDLDYHAIKEEKPLDINAFEADFIKRSGLIPEILPRYRSTYFAHIAAWGYSAGYYSYIWSGVLDNDAFEAFKETSLFDPATALSFRENVLEKNGMADPAELYRAFRGRDPKIDALLKNRGLK
jgi:peptidyl-dipeptidase Dcp